MKILHLFHFAPRFLEVCECLRVFGDGRNGLESGPLCNIYLKHLKEKECLNSLNQVRYFFCLLYRMECVTSNKICGGLIYMYDLPSHS